MKINIKNQTISYPINKCSECANAYWICGLDNKTYNDGCDRELLDIQEGEEPRGYPDLDYDPNDLNYDDKDKFLDEFQRGEH